MVSKYEITMSGGAGDRAALRQLAEALRTRVRDLAGHPFIPVSDFTDGELLAALKNAEETLADSLVAHGVQVGNNNTQTLNL